MEVALRDYVRGAAAVTDLALTVPGHRLGDRLTGTGELAALLDAHRIRAASLTEGDVADARALRDEVVALFGLDDAADVVAAADEMLVRCPHRLVAGPDHHEAKHGDWRVRTTERASTVDQLRLLGATSVLAVVHALGVDRLRSCAGPRCVGMYVDTSNTGRRRFCVPRVCGNRANVARYRARQAR